jgi:hypothetical protein
MVNSGKKIAIGGSITLTTQARPRNTPCQTKPVSHHGAPRASKAPAATSSTQNRLCASICDGTLAPMMVSQNTTASITSISGKPKAREVTMRSMRWSSSRVWPTVPRTARLVIRSTSP